MDGDAGGRQQNRAGSLVIFLKTSVAEQLGLNKGILTSARKGGKNGGKKVRESPKHPGKGKRTVSDHCKDVEWYFWPQKFLKGRGGGEKAVTAQNR